MIAQNISSQSSVKAFLFGSFVRDSHFHDVDIGLLGAELGDAPALREAFQESNFPYKVDVVDFSSVDEKFKEKVFHDGVLWLTNEKK